MPPAENCPSSYPIGQTNGAELAYLAIPVCAKLEPNGKHMFFCERPQTANVSSVASELKLVSRPNKMNWMYKTIIITINAPQCDRLLIFWVQNYSDGRIAGLGGAECFSHVDLRACCATDEKNAINLHESVSCTFSTHDWLPLLCRSLMNQHK